MEVSCRAACSCMWHAPCTMQLCTTHHAHTSPDTPVAYNCSLAIDVFNHMCQSGIECDVVTCCSLISAMEKGGQWELAEQVGTTGAGVSGRAGRRAGRRGGRQAGRQAGRKEGRQVGRQAGGQEADYSSKHDQHLQMRLRAVVLDVGRRRQAGRQAGRPVLARN